MFAERSASPPRSYRSERDVRDNPTVRRNSVEPIIETLSRCLFHRHLVEPSAQYVFTERRIHPITTENIPVAESSTTLNMVVFQTAKAFYM
jgi:hypothetical protein